MRIYCLLLFVVLVGNLFSQNLESLKKEYNINKSVYNFDKAFVILDSIKEYDKSYWVVEESISLNELTGNFIEAINIIKNDSDYSSSTVGLVRLADNYMKLSLYDSASDCYNKIDSSEYNYFLYEKRGDAEYGKGDINNSIKYYEKSYTEGNRSSNLFLKLTRIYVQMKLYDSALVLLEESVNIYPRNEKLLKLYTEVLFTKKDYLNTVNYGLRVINLGDTTYSITQKLGLAYYFIATENVSRETDIKFRESLKYLFISTGIDDSDPLNYFYIAMNYSAMDLLDSASTYFDITLLSIYPSYTADIFIQKASVKQKMGDYAEAIACFRKAVEHDSERKDILFYLASVYDKYYKDKLPAKNTYASFLRNNQKSDQKLVDYAQRRIEALTEIIHFSR